MSPNKEKILLILLKGIEFGYSYTGDRQWRVLKSLSREWKKIDQKKLRNEINQLYRSKVVGKKENPDGSYTITLTEKGKLKALTYFFDEIKLAKGDWDGKWRVVSFDIPEKMKIRRNIFRSKIKEIGFYEFQKSVWISPYKCKDEIDFIIEHYNLRRYVRFGTLDYIDNEIHLKKIFRLL